MCYKKWREILTNTETICIFANTAKALENSWTDNTVNCNFDKFLQMHLISKNSSNLN